MNALKYLIERMESHCMGYKFTYILCINLDNISLLKSVTVHYKILVYNTEVKRAYTFQK